MFFAKSILALAALATTASAVALRAANDVFSPPVTSPTAGEVWTVGSVQTVTWDTSSIPAANQNQTGLILLGFVEDGSTDEHLDIENPLASNFPIRDGAVNVTVPQVATRDDYIVVLFGDSGNSSPKFTIN
ncbi:hypothetical protein DICSQDRAFT_55831 [Dichomitus squalens LYAD-421 SS1]|uniref:uncharacterized protein n=1 Tax=Dichomitus squalens (strain LYAD-421) TaxID=732165 RepID=UPI0004413910|nr:uncharacterized protein DICSQDRAFT_55831 [Dichomitus squalens LYAD-421 SS1]EJF63332.1 hypothetical protein DICSQDRAFT_55831 [Dichomitus squalens LYAD-421 SS1]